MSDTTRRPTPLDTSPTIMPTDTPTIPTDTAEAAVSATAATATGTDANNSSDIAGSRIIDVVEVSPAFTPSVKVFAESSTSSSGRRRNNKKNSHATISSALLSDSDSDDSDYAASRAAAAAAAANNKRKRSSGGTGGGRTYGKSALARRQARLKATRAAERAQRKAEREERLAREAARRNGFETGNMICAAGGGVAGAGGSAKPSASAGSGAGSGSDEDDAAAQQSEIKAADFFWEVDIYLDRRETYVKSTPKSKPRKQVQYLIKWKGCPKEEATWEPIDNLCDSAYDDAVEWWRMEKERRKRIEENERKLGLLPPLPGAQKKKAEGDKSNNIKDADGDVTMTEATEEKGKGGNDAPKPSSSDVAVGIDALQSLPTSAATDVSPSVGKEPEEPMVEPPTPPPKAIEDPNWEWNDESQVNFCSVRRVSVHYANAKEIVTDARVNGVPVVLTGHAGWANFAKRWLRKKEKKKKTAQDTTMEVVPVSAEGGVPATPPTNDEEKKPYKGAPTTSTDGEEKKSEDGAPMMSTNAAEKESEGGAPILTNEEGKKPDEGAPTISTNEEEKKSDEGTEATEEQDRKLDLSDPAWYLDVKAMSDDIGAEEVPVVKRNYNEEAPISANISAAKFLEASWPNTDEKTTAATTTEASSSSKQAPHSALYLHQWQFPLSDSAAPKLCDQSEPLPNDILGEDLLKYWIDTISDCPLQYLFMGREETMSKIHKDPGGLAISIAPIVGEKECVLVHRDDGQHCLYHLQAPLDEIDLDGYPLLSQARIWKTTVKPGEILLMPQGTYHQCRNVTPCLSYSRFHLDTVNLRPFLQSLFDGDAPELAHDDILWNSAQELMKKVDKATDEAQKRLLGESDVAPVQKEKLDPILVRAVDTLRSLRHMEREVTRKLAVKQATKGGAVAATSSSSKIDGGAGKWQQLVDDIDLCLHEFRYRFSKHDPGFKPRRSHGRKKLAMPSVAMRGPSASIANGRGSQNTTSSSKVKKSNKGSGSSGQKRKKKSVPAASGKRARKVGQKKETDVPVTAFDTEMERAYLSLPFAPSIEGMSEVNKQSLTAKIGALASGDHIMASIKGKKCSAEILEVMENMYAAYMSYEDYPSLYDEYQPCDLLRMPYSGGGYAEVNPENIRPGLRVVSLVGERRDEYRGEIQHTKCERMYKVKMNFGKTKVERWIDSDSILSVEAKKDKSLLPREGFLSSEEEWGKRAARQQGIDTDDAISGSI